MQRQIKVEMLAPRPIVPIGKNPEGVTVGRLQSEIFNGPISDNLTLFFIVEISKDIAVGVLSAWLYDRIKQHNPKRIRIEQEEIILNQGEVERIVRKKLEITE